MKIMFDNVNKRVLLHQSTRACVTTDRDNTIKYKCACAIWEDYPLKKPNSHAGLKMLKNVSFTCFFWITLVPLSHRAPRISMPEGNVITHAR